MIRIYSWMEVRLKLTSPLCYISHLVFLYVNLVRLFPSNVCPWFAVDFVYTQCRHEPSIYAKDRLLRTRLYLVYVEQFLKRFPQLFEHFDGLQKKVEPTSMMFCRVGKFQSHRNDMKPFKLTTFLSKQPREFDWSCIKT